MVQGDAGAPDAAADQARLERLKKLAWLLDNSIRIPIIGRRIGIDALLGLIPVAGDAIGGALSTWVLYSGYRLGASWPTLLRMLGNVLVEIVVGIVPVLGDLFDMGFKANQRNVDLLLDYGRDAASTERRSALWALLVFGGLALVVLGAAVLAGWVVFFAFAALWGVLAG